MRNVLARLPPNFVDDLSVEQFYKKYEEPETVAVTRRDGQPLTAGGGGEDIRVPSRVVLPFRAWSLSAEDYTMADAHVILSDFGGTFLPGTAIR